VTTQNDLAVAAGASVDDDRWRAQYGDLMGRIAGRFARVETRRRAAVFVQGLMSRLPRKNCWTLAEHGGEASPAGLQHLMSRASWDHDGVRDDLRGYVVAGLGSQNAVLVVDETGDLKKGSHTVGVQRQYTGTAGRVENAQVAVYLAYTTDTGHAFIDRELYLPRSWADDPDRRAAAGVPAEVEFATKPALATTMVGRALDAGVAARWVTGDEVYGADPGLRRELEARSVGYVLAVGSDRRVVTGAGTMRADQVAKTLPRDAWQQRSAGAGAKGPRLYDWALVEIDADRPGHRWLLIRCNRTTAELAYYRCYSPQPVPLSALVTVAGRRWTVEEGFQTGKGLCGLDEHQVRRWVSWHRWTILSMLAHAFLAVLAATERSTRPDHGLIPMTCNEIQHLLNSLITSNNHDRRHCLRWSHWRRRHQHHARTCHYRRRNRERT
jgi:SRSO17 transposase